MSFGSIQWLTALLTHVPYLRIPEQFYYSTITQSAYETDIRLLKIKFRSLGLFSGLSFPQKETAQHDNT
jgi:hypothetical protein